MGKKKKELTLREFSMLGVKARQTKITPERRKEIATKAAQIRWIKAQRNAGKARKAEQIRQIKAAKGGK